MCSRVITGLWPAFALRCLFAACSPSHWPTRARSSQSYRRACHVGHTRHAHTWHATGARHTTHTRRAARSCHCARSALERRRRLASRPELADGMMGTMCALRRCAAATTRVLRNDAASTQRSLRAPLLRILQTFGSVSFEFERFHSAFGIVQPALTIASAPLRCAAPELESSSTGLSRASSRRAPIGVGARRVGRIMRWSHCCSLEVKARQCTRSSADTCSHR